MSKTLGDLLVVSDLDGTLLTAQEGLPSCNIAMIRLFQALGGRFTIASGRSVESVRLALGNLPLGAPAIVFNGAMLYDYHEEFPVSEHYLPKVTALEAIRTLSEAVPGVGVEILAADGHMYMPICGEWACRHASHESLAYTVAELDQVPGAWYKVLFAAAPAQVARLERIAAEHVWEGAYFIATSSTYFELMPQGVDKGAGLRELCALTGTALEDVVAIGDYFNDIPMLQAAGHPVAVENAVPELKLQAQQQVLSCTDGGVAQLLYSLIRQYGH